ncbi:hypothetical protein Tco_0760683, partial [Tanacetum coccineum]
MISMKNEGTEGTEEVHEGTEEVQESTAQVHEGTAQVNESTAEKIKVPLVFVKVPLVLSDILERTACFIRYRVIHEFWFLDGFWILNASFKGKIIMARIWRFIEEVIMKKIEYCLFDVVVEFH